MIIPIAPFGAIYDDGSALMLSITQVILKENPLFSYLHYASSLLIPLRKYVSLIL